MNINTDNLTRELYDAVGELLAWISNDLGHVITVQHCIELTDDTPFKQQCRRIPSAMFQKMRSFAKTSRHRHYKNTQLSIFKQYCSGKEEEQ